MQNVGDKFCIVNRNLTRICFRKLMQRTSGYPEQHKDVAMGDRN